MSPLLSFLNESITPYHAIHLIEKLLQKRGFKPLDEKETFKLKPKGKYYVIRDSGSLIAFIVPEKTIENARVLLSHSDSPTFRLKPKGEHVKGNMIFWDLEVYGGPIYAAWLNRDLAVAGRIFVEDKGEIKEHLVNLKDYPVMITGLPIHIQRTVNTEGLKLSAQEHLSALAGLTDKKELKTSLLESLLKKTVKSGDLLHHELYLYPLEEANYLGYKNDLISSPRIDNLWSAYGSIEAFLKLKESAVKTSMPMLYIANHEEIGSRTYSGADSSFFISIFERVFYQKKQSFENLKQCLAKSMALSLDGAHALDPKSEKEFEPRHTPLLGEGVTIKIDTGGAYSYSSTILALIQKVAKAHKIKIQNAVKKGDQRQGSTLGPLFVEQTGIAAIDLGCAQLSMHSVREVASLKDYDQMIKLLTLFYAL